MSPASTPIAARPVAVQLEAREQEIAGRLEVIGIAPRYYSLVGGATGQGVRPGGPAADAVEQGVQALP